MDIRKTYSAAQAHHQAGRLDEAEALYKQILAADPRHADSLHMLGVLLYQTQRAQAAAARIEEAIALAPKAAPYHFNLGNIRQGLGQLETAAACYRAALACDADFAQANNNLGVCLKALGRPQEAVLCYRRAMEQTPGSALAHGNLGRALKELGRLEEAAACFRTACDLEPHSTAARNDLAAALAELDQLEETERHYRTALAHTPDDAQLRNNLGAALEGQRRFDEAALCYRQALDLQPQFQAPCNNLGNVRLAQDRFDEAIACFEAALKLGPDAAQAWYGLSRCRKFTAADRALIAAMEKALDGLKPSDQHRSSLHFALGKVFDDLGAYETAMRHFDEANRLDSAKKHFDSAGFAATVDWLIEEFPQHALPAPAASLSQMPVFIMGLPRSGTTLVEQVLARHSRIAAGGELRFWSQRAHGIKNRAVAQLDRAAAQSVSGEYLTVLKGIGANSARVTDKMPGNFLFLGLLHRLFPKARLVHCRRNPADTALSLYFSQFTRQHDFAYRRADIVRYVQQYQRLMAHWRSVLPPAQFLEMDYEQLIAQPEPTSRRLVEFCGLGWEAACLDFYKAPHPVATASAWQVRQPLYRSSVERWRNYEPWLGELRQLLAPVAG